MATKLLRRGRRKIPASEYERRPDLPIRLGDYVEIDDEETAATKKPYRTSHLLGLGERGLVEDRIRYHEGFISVTVMLDRGRKTALNERYLTRLVLKPQKKPAVDPVWKAVGPRLDRFYESEKGVPI